MKFPKWFIYACIVLNTLLGMVFYSWGQSMFALVSFLSACCFWLNLIVKDMIDEHRNSK